MGNKEGTCDEHWMLYVSVKSLNSIPEAEKKNAFSWIDPFEVSK